VPIGGGGIGLDRERLAGFAGGGVRVGHGISLRIELKFQLECFAGFIGLMAGDVKS
ncbi:TPA: hypothetical protein IHM15_004714, partial [Escherichia coli]|nr:hypothetical protein [Escherichia coli]